jgi:hypothetical protein
MFLMELNQADEHNFPAFRAEVDASYGLPLLSQTERTLLNCFPLRGHEDYRSMRVCGHSFASCTYSDG